MVPLYQAFGQAVHGLYNAQKAGSQAMIANYTDRIEYLCMRYMPSRGEFSGGTTFDLTSSNFNYLVFATTFQRTSVQRYRVVVKPAFVSDFIVDVRGHSFFRKAVANAFRDALIQPVGEVL